MSSLSYSDQLKTDTTPNKEKNSLSQDLSERGKEPQINKAKKVKTGERGQLLVGGKRGRKFKSSVFFSDIGDKLK